MAAAPEARTLLFHKPYGVLSQFTPEAGSSWRCLAEFIPVPGVYAAGRLDADSEGLLLLTGDGRLQRRLTDPACGHWRRYWVQVEGDVAADPRPLERLVAGVVVQGRRTLPARARILPAEELAAAAIAERDPPIRRRLAIPTSWLELELREGRNRQVRRMTAAVGHPTLRLLRVAIDLMDGQPPLGLEGLPAGRWREVTAGERQRLARLGRGGRAGGGKSGRAGGGG
ncbi:MAG: pseudouridine synthase [Synechococcaceae cyanobacterium]